MSNKVSVPVLVVFILGIYLTGFKNTYPEEISYLKEIENEIVQLVNNINPSIVSISAKYDYTLIDDSKGSLLQFKSEKRQPVEITNIGSGFILDSTHILTKSTVIMGSKEINVTFYDSTIKKATYVGTDPELGLSIIKVDHIHLKPLKIDDSKHIKPGCWVLLIGNSLGMAPSVSLGIINCKIGRETMQISANVSAGNAGGAVFNTDGNLVGLLTGMSDDITENTILGSSFFANQTTYAYPSDVISESVSKIISRSRFPQGWIGVTAEDWPGYLGGVHINHVTRNSPADIAGIQIGDIIVSINDKKINHTMELANYIKYHHPGSEIKLELLRGTGQHTIKINIGEQPEPESASFFTSSPAATTPPPALLESINLKQKTDSPENDNKLLLKRIDKLERELKSMRSMIKTSRQ
ncbi:trypsin-like peptidase domain-containing protein [candidate division KSB1 bacterium]|nr:trypsin-like peptidase domain-containing protein [candidate division KSB1 bacterium]